MLLETYSSLDGENLLNCLPKFLNIVKEVTGDPSFSMFNLSLKEDWSKTKKFCHSLHGKDQRANQALDQAYHDCNNDVGSAINAIVQTNGMAQLNNHNNTTTTTTTTINNKAHCESSKKHNNHENHHVHNECHATGKNTVATATVATTPQKTTTTTNTITPNKSFN